ncbi:hypothetical protein DFP72DRAFT_857350 [Ephemerocybe angulata]|uniref:Uncharacterized protein n=1 Tax=Ephemerocybe angulata TaxID=980116 RepID=A0A8H6LXT1_9AGAR|nr:hypothetical protein DFP72DRAFT_857350 [Tulosesus angulatus]
MRGRGGMELTMIGCRIVIRDVGQAVLEDDRPKRRRRPRTCQVEVAPSVVVYEVGIEAEVECGGDGGANGLRSGRENGERRGKRGGKILTDDNKPGCAGDGGELGGVAVGADKCASAKYLWNKRQRKISRVSRQHEGGTPVLRTVNITTPKQPITRGACWDLRTESLEHRNLTVMTAHNERRAPYVLGGLQRSMEATLPRRADEEEDVIATRSSGLVESASTDGDDDG